MVNFPTCIPDCDSHSPTFLDLFISYNTGICSTIAFPPLRNSDQVVVSVFVDFTSNSWNVCFIAELMTILKLIWTVFVIIWEIFHIVKLGASAASSEILWAGSDWNWCIYISHRNYQVKSHSSLWFSAACAATIAHRNHFFCLHQMSKSSYSEVKFRQARNHFKRALEAAKLAYANKTKDSITSQKPGSWEFWQIANSVLNKGKSGIPTLIKNCSLKTFLRTLILMMHLFSILKLIWNCLIYL